jgi:hypothetical protein
MRLLPAMAMIVAFGALSGSAGAQVPFPFGGPQRPENGKMPQCTKAYVKSVEDQIKSMEKLRATGPELVGQVCSLIESGSAWIGGELPDGIRKQIKDMLGVDVDLRFIKAQCRLGQGNLDREVMTEIGYLRSELARCNDTI